MGEHFSGATTVLSMIGQFGVGLFWEYSVSDKVRVVSENNDYEQFILESAAGGSFTEQKDNEIVERGICVLVRKAFQCGRAV